MNAWSPTSPCTPEACVTVPAQSVALTRRLLRCLGCAAALVVGVVLLPLVLGCRRLPGERAARNWGRLLAAALGVRIRSVGPPVAGTAHEGGVLLVANHVSWLDILLIAAVQPGRMLAKTEVRGWPVLGGLAAWGGTIFIERERLRSLPRTVEEIAAALRRGERVVVFPEGSTWCGRSGGRFRPAAFQAALAAGVPVQPVLIRYRLAGGEPTTAPAFVGEDGLLPSVWRVAAVRGLVGEVTLLPQLPAGRYQDRRALAWAAQAGVDGHRFPAHRFPAHPGHRVDQHRCSCGDAHPAPRRPRRRSPVRALAPAARRRAVTPGRPPAG